MTLKRLIAKPLSAQKTQQVKDAVLERVFSSVEKTAMKIYLFGSVVDNNLTEMSDVDVLMTFKTEKDLKKSKENFYKYPQKMIWPVDAVFLLDDYFESMRDVGGLCFTCARNGQLIFDKTKSQTTQHI